MTANDDAEHWTTVIADCEGLFLQVFGSSNNFSIVDRMKFATMLNEIALGQTGLMTEDGFAKVGKLSGATHIYHISGLVSHKGRKQTVFFSGRLIDIQAGKVISVDKMED